MMLSLSIKQVQRVEVFNSALQSKVEIDLRTFDHVDMDSLTARMEGYVAQDIVTVVERAIHAGCSRELMEGSPRPAPTPQEQPDRIQGCKFFSGFFQNFFYFCLNFLQFFLYNLFTFVGILFTFKPSFD